MYLQEYYQKHGLSSDHFYRNSVYMFHLSWTLGKRRSSPQFLNNHHSSKHVRGHQTSGTFYVHWCITSPTLNSEFRIHVHSILCPVCKYLRRYPLLFHRCQVLLPSNGVQSWNPFMQSRFRKLKSLYLWVQFYFCLTAKILRYIAH
jgi:hypothetical protein